MTVKQLDANLGEGELAYWRAYLDKRPASEFASWFQLGSLIRVLATPPKGKGKPPALADLIPSFDF